MLASTLQVSVMQVLCWLAHYESVWYKFYVIKHITSQCDTSGRDRIVVEFKTTYAIITDDVSLNLDQGEMYNIMWSSLSVTCDRSVDFSGSSAFLLQ